MYAWLADLLADRRSRSPHLKLAEVGASEAALAALEARLGIALPADYRAWLAQWDGGEAWGVHIFGTQALRHHVDEIAGFEPIGHQAQLSDTGGRAAPDRFSKIYRHKPPHFLPFAAPTLSSDLFCFDTRRAEGGRSPVCLFEHDRLDPAHLHRVRGPSFKQWLLAHVAGHATQELDHFLDEEADDEDGAIEWAEERLEYWEERFPQEVEALGGRMEAWEVEWHERS